MELKLSASLRNLGPRLPLRLILTASRCGAQDSLLKRRVAIEFNVHGVKMNARHGADQPLQVVPIANVVDLHAVTTTKAICASRRLRH